MIEVASLLSVLAEVTVDWPLTEYKSRGCIFLHGEFRTYAMSHAYGTCSINIESTLYMWHSE